MSLQNHVIPVRKSFRKKVYWPTRNKEHKSQNNRLKQKFTKKHKQEKKCFHLFTISCELAKAHV